MAFQLNQFHLPPFKKRTNPAELLRLYITFDLLEPATALAMEYIDAVLVDGRAPFFGVTVGTHVKRYHFQGVFFIMVAK